MNGEEIDTSGYRIMVIITAFQAEDVGSIPTTRSVTVAEWFMRLFVEQVNAGSNPVGHPIVS